MKLLIVLAGALLAGLAAVSAVQADAVYHSDHIRLMPVDSAPLRSGFVENIHTSGPINYAHEVYALNGAEPNTTYEVHLFAYAFDPDCSGEPMDFGGEELTTNRAGNGVAQRLFLPADLVPEFRNATHGIIWEVQLNGETMYATDCTPVTLD